jgi:hypothetical protein
MDVKPGRFELEAVVERLKSQRAETEQTIQSLRASVIQLTEETIALRAFATQTKERAYIAVQAEAQSRNKAIRQIEQRAVTLLRNSLDHDLLMALKGLFRSHLLPEVQADPKTSSSS